MGNVVVEAQGPPIVAGAAGVAATAPVDASGPYGEIDEPSQANLLGTTAAIVRTMTDVGWVNGGTVTVGSATGADGVASAAASLTFGAVAATNTILFTTVLGAADRVSQPLVRRKTGSGTVQMTIDGSTWVTFVPTSVYGPFPLATGNIANPIVGFKGLTNADAIEVDFNGLVAGTVAPAAPIPVNVTTAAEVDQYVSSGNIAAAMSGTMQITPVPSLGSSTVFHFATYVDANNYTAVLSDGTNLIARKRISGSSHDATIAWSRTAGTMVKVGWRFDGTGSQIFLSGTAGTADATTTAAQIGTNFQIGADGNGANQDYCEHRLFTAYPVSLSNGQLSALTT